MRRYIKILHILFGYHGWVVVYDIVMKKELVVFDKDWYKMMYERVNHECQKELNREWSKKNETLVP